MKVEVVNKKTYIVDNTAIRYVGNSVELPIKSRSLGTVRYYQKFGKSVVKIEPYGVNTSKVTIDMWVLKKNNLIDSDYTILEYI